MVLLYPINQDSFDFCGLLLGIVAACSHVTTSSAGGTVVLVA